MALELRFKVENLGVAVAVAGYTVIDSVRTEIENGTTSINEDGTCVIPITSKWVSLNEQVRVTVDDFDGNNFELTGTATDWVKTTEAYVSYAVHQDGYTVDCVNETGITLPWDFGDGETSTEVNPVHVYKYNGTFTITNGDFSKTIVVDTVNLFNVEVLGNKINCTNQSGQVGPWDMGDGVFIGLLDPSYVYYKNGEYTVQNGPYSKVINIDYFTDGVVISSDKNIGYLGRPNGASGDFSYGDLSNGSSEVKEYAQHGIYLVDIQDEHGALIIEPQLMPVAYFTYSSDLEKPNKITFVGTGGDDYEFLIDGITYTSQTVVVEFADSGFYDIEMRANSAYGNSNKYSENIRVFLVNEPPTGEITASASKLNVVFSSNASDEDPLTYTWSMGDNSKGEYLKGTSLLSANPEYAYRAPLIEGDLNGQTFTVTCLIEDNRGGSISLSKEITVYDFVQASDNELVPDFSFDKSVLDAGWVDATGSNEYELITDEERSVLHVTSLNGSQSYLQYELTVEVGKRYALNAVMKAEAVIIYNSDLCGISLFDSGASVISEKIENGGYTPIEDEFVAKSKTVYLRVYTRREGSQLWLDTLSLREVV